MPQLWPFTALQVHFHHLTARTESGCGVAGHGQREKRSDNRSDMSWQATKESSSEREVLANPFPSCDYRVGAGEKHFARLISKECHFIYAHEGRLDHGQGWRFLGQRVLSKYGFGGMYY